MGIKTADLKLLLIVCICVCNITTMMHGLYRSVCRHWKKLEELEVYGGKLTTEGITGIYDIRGASVKEYNPTNITCLTSTLARVIFMKCNNIQVLLAFPQISDSSQWNILWEMRK